MSGFRSWLGLRGQLNETISAQDTWVDVAVVARLGDELVEVVRVDRGTVPGEYTVHVRRGVLGTTASPHPDGTVLEPVDWSGVLPRDELPPSGNRLRDRIRRMRRPDGQRGYVG
jgi:hypothetical protein